MPSQSPPELLARIDALFARALALPEEARAAFLDRECAGDEGEVREAVERLLARSASPPMLATGGALAVLEGRAGDDDPESPATSRRIGSWRLREEIGRGGMGVVFRAERADGAFEQEAAVKILRERVAGPAGVARFERERQIVARLSHPSICRLLDGGVAADGRPWFAMERVDGLPIDSWADAHRLSVSRRVELVEEVGRAVAYAHRNLVVHRDLKPSNVLVSADGGVCLLDFGIAKPMAQDEGASTEAATRVLTPEYASPEQLRGEPVTTASDVFQLGLLLYELLSGCRARAGPSAPSTPVPGAAGGETVRPSRALRLAGTEEAEAEAVARLRGTDARGLRRKLAGDLDQIVLTALRPEPERRYGSAAELVADLERHRAGLPVSARPDTLAYRLAKLWQRRRAAVVAGLAFVVLLATVAVGTAFHAQRIAAERDRAEIERERAERVKSYALGLFSIADPERRPGPEVAVVELLDQGVRRARAELAAEPEVLAEILGELARIYANLSLYRPAEDLLRQAVEIRSAAAGEETRETAALLGELGAVLLESDAAEAREVLERALDVYRASGGADSPEAARILVLLARDAHSRHLYGEVEELLRRALAVHRRHLAPDDPQIAADLGDLARAINQQGRPEEAETLHREALEIFRVNHDDLHPDVASALNNLAIVVWDQGRWAEGDELMTRSIDLMRDLYGDGHADIATSLGNWATSLVERGEPARGADRFRAALAMRRQVLGARHVRVAQTTAQLAEALHAAGAPEEAEPLLGEAVEIFRESLPQGHPSFGRVLRALGAVLLDLGRPTEAEGPLEEMMAIYEGRDRPDLVARGGRLLAEARWRQGRFAEAEDLLLDGLAGLGGDPELREPQLAALVDLYAAWGRPERADRLRAVPGGEARPTSP